MKVLLIIAAAALLTLPVVALAQVPAHGTGSESAPVADGGLSSGLGYLAAALSVGLGSIGAGFAVASTASAAVGAVAEREEVMGKALIYVGLAEGIAIYGLVIAVLILNRL